MVEKLQRKELLNDVVVNTELINGTSIFSDLLGKEPNIPDMDNPDEIQTGINETDLNIKTGLFAMDEYQNVKKVLQTGQAAGEDGFYPEVLKICNLDKTMLNYANKLLVENQKPQQWADINLIPIPKTGDLGFTANYRGIIRCCEISQSNVTKPNIT